LSGVQASKSWLYYEFPAHWKITKNIVTTTPAGGIGFDEFNAVLFKTTAANIAPKITLRTKYLDGDT
jgi:hypothetical protein